MSFPLKRIADISTILLRYGFKELGALFGQSGQEIRGAEALAMGHGKAVTASSKNRPVRLRQAMEELGPTYIKLGQLLSTRPDLVGPTYADEFCKLQDQVPPFEFKTVKRIIREELGKEINEIFADFSEIPSASASLSQVHQAVLPNGKKVAVKVQRPDIEKIILQDIKLLKKVAKLIEKRHTTQVIKPSEIIKTFEKSILQEINFEHEAEILEQFATLYKNHPLLVIPHSYPDLSSQRLVTMDFIAGLRINDRKGLIKAGLDLPVLARNGLDIILSQIFEYGIFHGDPHPGNILVLPDGRLSYVDFGLTGTLSRSQKKGALKLLISLVEQNTDTALEALRELDVLKDENAVEKLKPHLAAIFKKFGNLPLGKINFATLVNELIKIMRDNNLRLPRDLMLLVKAIATSEAIGAKLDPDFHLINEVKPYLEKVLRDELKPGLLFKRIRDFSRRNLGILEKTPEAINATLDQVRKGRATIKIQHKGLERVEKAVDIGSNQIAYGLITAALIVAGATIASIPGFSFFGLNIFSYLLFGIAFIVAVFLVISILRERKK